MNKFKMLDFVEQYGDGIHGTPQYDEEGTYYFINGNNLIDGHIKITEDTLKISETEYEKIKRPLNDNTLLVSINGTLGRVAVYNGEKVALGKSACYINLKEGVNKYFIKAILCTAEFQKYIQMVAHGSTIKNLAPSQIVEYEFCAPDEEMQNKLAEILKALEDKIENNNNIVMEFSKMAKVVFENWFLQYEFPVGGKTYRLSNGKMRYDKKLKREVPVGWQTVRCGDLFETNRGVSYSTPDIETGEGVPMINLATFGTDGQYKSDGIKYYSGNYSSDKLLQPYDLVMCNTQQTAIDYGKDIIGKAIIVPDIFGAEDIVSSHHVNVIKTYKPEMKYYLYHLFNSDFWHKYIAGFANGTNILGLVFEGVTEYYTEVPDDETLMKFAELMQDIEEKKSLILKENMELVKLRDFLLPLLINGQVTFQE